MTENIKPNYPEFEVHRLSEEGLKNAGEIASHFNELMFKLFDNGLIETDKDNGRLISIVKTKLEEACFFAKKALAVSKKFQA
jgi:hypothetical protein